MKGTLSKIAIADLIEFVAVNAENYDRYSAYAEKRGWHKFSPGYFHNWVNRHRDEIRAARHMHLIEVRKAGVLDRTQRIARLEARANEIEALLQRAAAAGEDDESPAVSVDTVLRMMEQQRKILQAIAQENGEWNTKPDEGEKNTGAHAKLAEKLMSAYVEPDNHKPILVAGVDEIPDEDGGE